jgi:TBC1 domain family member 5
LKNTIRNDVGRTFQERPLFQVPRVQELMVSILFTWAKEHPEISYKQGMNELLGIILFVAYADRAPEDLSISRNAAEYLRIINNPEAIEANIYWCFARLMDLGITELFNPVVTHNQYKNKADLFTWDTEKTRNDLVNQDKSTAEGVSSVLKRCHKIHHRILQSIDKELYLYLEKQKIEPQMYLQRYLRCILSREFNLADTLIIWDALFASLSSNSDFKAANQANLCKELNLLDFVCVAMITFVRAFGN